MILAQHIQLLAGTYTNKGKSEGIYVYDFDLKTGDATLISSIASENPSFLALSADGKYVYAVNENGEGKGAVSAYVYDDRAGRLVFLNHRLTLGGHPSHVTTHQAGTPIRTSQHRG